MATENKVLDVSVVAAEDLSDDQYKFVVLSSSGVRRPDSETEVAYGILQNAPESGEAAAVRLIGITKFHANAALGVGAWVMPEYVSATDAGKGKTAAAAPQYARGFVVEPTDAEDDLGSILLCGPVPAINDAVAHATTVTTKTTAGAVTYTAAELIGGLVLRDPNGASRSDISPTAALIVAGIAGAIVGSSFEFTIRNTADGDETITLTAGAGVTLSGTMTVKRYHSRLFLAVCTNVGSGTEAVTIYSIGDAANAATESLYGVVAAGSHTTTGGAAAEDIEVTGMLETDVPIVTVQNDGTNNRTLLASVAKAGGGNITCTFSGDPGADLIVNYIVLRALG
jgi:hypothetical protein